MIRLILLAAGMLLAVKLLNKNDDVAENTETSNTTPTTSTGNYEPPKKAKLPTLDQIRENVKKVAEWLQLSVPDNLIHTPKYKILRPLSSNKAFELMMQTDINQKSDFINQFKLITGKNISVIKNRMSENQILQLYTKYGAWI